MSCWYSRGSHFRNLCSTTSYTNLYARSQQSRIDWSKIWIWNSECTQDRQTSICDH